VAASYEDMDAEERRELAMKALRRMEAERVDPAVRVVVKTLPEARAIDEQKRKGARDD
jgi:hypothetical protein